MKTLSMDLLISAVREGRKALHLSQAALAEKAGMNRTMIGRLEARDYIPSIRQLEKLGEAGVQAPAVRVISDK